MEHSQSLEISIKEKKLAKETAKKLEQEKEKIQKKLNEVLKPIEGSGFARASIHSNRSNDRKIEL